MKTEKQKRKAFAKLIRIFTDVSSDKSNSFEFRSVMAEVVTAIKKADLILFNEEMDKYKNKYE